MADIMPQNALQGASDAPQASQMAQQGDGSSFGQNLATGGSGASMGQGGRLPQQTDPTVPTSTEGVNTQLARYRARRNALVSEAQQTVQTKDPFAMDLGGAVTDDTKKQTQKDVWLASTAVAARPIPTFNQEEHKNFSEHWDNDPAVKEIHEKGAWEVVDTLAEMVKRGDLTLPQAIAQLQDDGFTGAINDIITKHHSDNPHSMLHHPMKTGRGNPIPSLGNTEVSGNLTNSQATPIPSTGPTPATGGQA